MATFFEVNPQRLTQWGRIRRGGGHTAAQFTIHTYEAPAGRSALAGATYLLQRTTPGSYHWLGDANGGYLQLAPWSAETWHCKPSNNWAVGGSLMMYAHTWGTVTAEQRRNLIRTIALGAARFSQWLIAQGRAPVPARMLTRAEAMRKEPGFVYHRTMDPGRRTDPANPASQFPWAEFLTEYERLLGQDSTPSTPAAPAAPSTEPETILEELAVMTVYTLFFHNGVHHVANHLTNTWAQVPGSPKSEVILDQWVQQKRRALGEAAVKWHDDLGNSTRNVELPQVFGRQVEWEDI